MQPLPPDHVHPLDERFMRWTRRQVMKCIRANEPETAGEALRPIWERVKRSSRFSDSAFAAIQRLRDVGVLYDDEGASLLNDIYEYRSQYYHDRDPEFRRIIHEMVTLTRREPRYSIRDSAESAVLQRRGREIKALYLRARGELNLSERVLADDPSLIAEFYDGEDSLVKEKRPMPPVEPPDGAWVALLRERIAALINAEDAPTTFQLLYRLHDVLRQASPSSTIEAVQQLRDVGVISRGQAFSLIDDAVGRVLRDAVASDRRAARLFNIREGLRMREGEHTPSIDEAFERRSNQLRAYWLRRFGQHEMAERLRRDPAAYGEIVDRLAFSDWFEAQTAERERE